MSSSPAPSTPDDPHLDFARAVGRAFKAERERQGLSIYRLARLTGLNEQAIRFIENEDRVARLDTASRIAHGLGIELHVLLAEVKTAQTAKDQET